jgi:hypothetical protein
VWDTVHRQGARNPNLWVAAIAFAVDAEIVQGAACPVS